VFAARAARLPVDLAEAILQLNHRGAGLMLARWVGASAAERPTSGSPPWQSTAMDGDMLSEHLKKHPELVAISAEIDAAETEARLAQANKKSDISVEASYAQRGPAFSNMLSIGVSIPLQWDQKNRQNRELAAKLAMVSEAKARYEDMLRKVEAEARNMLNEWQTGKDRLVRYREELIPIARQRSEAAQTAYRTGKGDLAGALAARRDEIESRIQAMTLELETARSWAQLNFLVPEHSMSAQAKEQP
jgi:outer membrane protein TolC